MADLSSVGGDSPCPRTEEPPLTCDFASAWPAIERPLRRYVASRGVTSHDIDDVVQEVATRVLRRSLFYSGAEDLQKYCFVVARNLVTDEARGRRRVTSGVHELSALADPCGSDALDQVEDRLLLESVSVQLSHLSEREQAALTPTRREASATERNRAAVARHRARNRLRALVGPLAGVISVAGAGFRKLLEESRRVATLAPAAAILLLVIGGGALRAPAGPSQATGTRPTLDSAMQGPGTQPSRQAAVRRRQIGQSPRVTAPTNASHPTAATHEVVGITGPASAHLGVGLRPQEADDPFLCVGDSGDPKALCVDTPTACASGLSLNPRAYWFRPRCRS